MQEVLWLLSPPLLRGFLYGEVSEALHNWEEHLESDGTEQMIASFLHVILKKQQEHIKETRMLKKGALELLSSPTLGALCVQAHLAACSCICTASLRFHPTRGTYTVGLGGVPSHCKSSDVLGASEPLQPSIFVNAGTFNLVLNFPFLAFRKIS